MKAIITVGISASGKSTFAKEWISNGDIVQRMDATFARNRVEVNRDNIRRELVEQDGRGWSWSKWNWKREKEVTVIANALIANAAMAKLDVIVSDTNLNVDKRGHMVELLESYGYVVEIKEFPITLEEAWKRDASRVDGVGYSVIARQYDQWLENSDRKKYVADITKPKCILVDIDGTLAHMNGKRGAFEWHNVGRDDVDEMVRMVVNMFSRAHSDNHVIVLSGRDGVCEPETNKWLIDNGVFFDSLIMRTPDDMRKDTIVKEEIFWRDIADNYNVQFVIDDRPSVCRMWRELGVKTFQVGNPHIEF